MGRVELAGHLTIPRDNQRALTLGDPQCVMVSAGDENYRPTGGKPGRHCALQPIGRQAGRDLGAADRQLTAESAGRANWICPQQLPMFRLRRTSTQITYTKRHVADVCTGPALGGGAG